MLQDARWTFEVVGQTGSQTYSVTGLDRFSQTGGPTCAFLLLAPGDYVIRLTLNDGSGNTDTDEVEITVSDPDADYPNTQTVVISTSGTFTGAPAGAQQVTGSAPSSFESDKRYLYRWDETFSSITIPMGATGWYVGNFGSGTTKPIVPVVAAAESSSLTTWPHTGVIRGLKSSRIEFNTTTQRVTLYDNDVDRPASGDSMIGFCGAMAFYRDNHNTPNSIYWPREIYIVDNFVRGDTGNDSTPNIAVYGSFGFSGIMGNDIDLADEHSLRVFQHTGLFIGHNRCGGRHSSADTSKHALKMHSANDGTIPQNETYNDSTGVTGDSLCSQDVTIADNIFGHADFPAPWLVQIGPQNQDPGTLEGTKNGVYERNHHIRGSSTTDDLNVVARNFVTRDNTTEGSTFAGNAINPGEYPNSDPHRAAMKSSWCNPYAGQLT